MSWLHLRPDSAAVSESADHRRADAFQVQQVVESVAFGPITSMIGASASNSTSHRRRVSLADCYLSGTTPDRPRFWLFGRICTLIFPQAKGCRSLQRYRQGWLAFAAEAVNVCPVGRWKTGRE
jgi:hypothetical protein